MEVITDDGAIHTEEGYLDKILDNIYISNGVGACTPSLIEGAGINAIVNMALEFRDEKLYSFPVIRCGMRGDNLNSPEQIYYAVNEFTRLINEGRTVLSHCYAGHDRSVLVVAAHLVQSGKHKTIAEACDFISSVRPRFKGERPVPLLFKQFSELYDK